MHLEITCNYIFYFLHLSSALSNFCTTVLKLLQKSYVFKCREAVTCIKQLWSGPINSVKIKYFTIITGLIHVNVVSQPPRKENKNMY